MSSNLLDSLLFSFLEITENAAIASFDWIGKGQEKQADQAAVSSMRNDLNKLNVKSRIIIGEGERDEAPMLYIGEELGKGESIIEIAVDPLEGTTICAQAQVGAMAVLAYGLEDCFLHAPDVYMEKIAVGAGLPENIIDLSYDISRNLTELARAKKKTISELLVTVLNRPRHQELIAKIRELGAGIRLIQDGDISAVLNTDSICDIYVGSGGAPEGVLAAAGLKAIGGQMHGRLLFQNEQQRMYASRLGIVDFNRIYNIEEMVRKDAILCLTYVTDSLSARGVRKLEDSIQLTSKVYHVAKKKILKIEASSKL